MAVKIAIVVLAAGKSQRFGSANKLLSVIDGVPLVRRVVLEALCAEADDVIVVTGYDEALVRGALDDLACRFVLNSEFEIGIGNSIGKGIGALGADVYGAMILPADLVNMTRDVLNELIGAFRNCNGQAVIIPHNSKGEQRNPVIWPRSLFPRLMSLSGDRGGKSLLYRGGAPPVVLRFEDDSVFLDIDTPEGF